MNTLVRSYTTTNLGRRLNGYEPLDHYYKLNKENLGRRTPSSKAKNVSTHHSLGYRVARAKQRQIFLQSYKLASRSELRRSRSSSGKLKKVTVKLRTVVVSLVSFLRLGASRSSCTSRAAICAASPMRVTKFC